MSPTSISGKSLVQNSRKNAQKTTLVISKSYFKMILVSRPNQASLEIAKVALMATKVAALGMVLVNRMSKSVQLLIW